MINKIKNPIIRMINPNAKKLIPIASSFPWADGEDFDRILLTFSSRALFAPAISKEKCLIMFEWRMLKILPNSQPISEKSWHSTWAIETFCTHARSYVWRSLYSIGIVIEAAIWGKTSCAVGAYAAWKQLDAVSYIIT